MSAAKNIRCATCGHTHSPSVWAARPTLRLIREEELRPYVVAWNERAIEVRACAGCGREIARLA